MCYDATQVNLSWLRYFSHWLSLICVFSVNKTLKFGFVSHVCLIWVLVTFISNFGAWLESLSKWWCISAYETFADLMFRSWKSFRNKEGHKNSLHNSAILRAILQLFWSNRTELLLDHIYWSSLLPVTRSVNESFKPILWPGSNDSLKRFNFYF